MKEAAMADDTDTATDTKVDDKPDTADLGDGGKKALDAERKARRDAERRANELESRLKTIEDKDKSETERLTEENARLQSELSTATVTGTRLRVAFEKGLTATQAKRLVGATEDELLADADELLADLGAKPSDDRTNTPPPGGRPREQLKPGSGDPDTPVEETDIRVLGERMFRR
jgi:hypothetical protein